MADHENNEAETVLPLLKNSRVADARSNFLPYPTSTMGPAIVPNDLTSFRSRGASETEKRLRQELVELQEKYVAAIDRFNWNRLVYTSDFRFEPQVGKVYHLYKEVEHENSKSPSFSLSMIGPNEWEKEHIGSFRLNIDRCWELVELAPEIRPEVLFASLESY